MEVQIGIWKQYENNRDAHTDAKADLIVKWTVGGGFHYGR